MAKNKKDNATRPRRYSKLPDHKRHKKILSPPFNNLPAPLTPKSWINERLPNMLWAVLLSATLPRGEYMRLFSQMAARGQDFKENHNFVAHSRLAAETSSDFRSLLRPILASERATTALKPLLLLEGLPDFEYWRTIIPTPDPERDWETLARAVAHCIDHQSEPSTDIRWMRVAFRASQGKLVMPENMGKRLVDYQEPNGFRLYGAMIRATELMLEASFDDEPQSMWPAEFWDSCLKNTDCFCAPLKKPNDDFPHNEAAEENAKVYAHLMEHCLRTISTTALDARHDGVFGLGFYGLTLVASALHPHSMRPVGRIALRALAEVYISLSFLLKTDDPSLWRRFRSYGSGQAKLAFLKILERGDELPKYVELSTLERLANEDMWQEFVDIDVGHWANKDLRRMSEEAGVKDVYDAYYDWPSTFVHGQWPAIRNTVFEVCLNPLHRLHRIPRPPRIDMEDVSWDAVRIGNKILDLVNLAYPGFGNRLHPADQTSNEKTPSSDPN